MPASAAGLAFDPDRPWLAPFAPRMQRLAQRTAAGADAAAALAAEPSPIALAAGALRFVAGDSAPPGEAYEAFIHRSACVPTRDNLHDLFNGLVWLQFPEAKRRLNALQAAEIARAGVGARRGPVRDALTVFDENGAVLEAPDALWEALLARDWQRLFVSGRALWREARLQLFGHALLEKLCHPRKAVTAHLLRAPGLNPSLAPGDSAIAAALDAAHFATKPFVPLPVLGVPGWWPQNQNFSFYDDSEVFRPRRVPTNQIQRMRPCSAASFELEAQRAIPTL